ncbi:odorant receptor 111-9 [Danio rerio]|uniref:Odorant receptor 111-9 n=1 Tax=Danio rerio TaxID=7955 RepID=Q9I8Z1_DANRE|nr:odorant receptor 111-9 [Danio rerio]AAF27267.1 odorant receptor 2.9 [Danio rerio]|eukprot:NP_571820.1 odorant receptor, family D, subfamily 111, member 9 [Danio rerio]
MSLYENNSIVRPEYFFIIGLSGIPNSSYYYIFLFIIYCITVIGNSLVLLIIALDRSLHSAKYLCVFNLALADFGETNAVIPNMLKTFLFDSQYISYNACLANMFFVNYFINVQSATLVVLAFDRVIAICLPLRYHSIVNNIVMLIVFFGIWTLNTLVVALSVSLMTRLSICKSNVVESYYCDYGPVLRLACNDSTVNKIITNVIAVMSLVAPVILIVLSYLGIFFALSKITTWEGRLKALKTCVSHLLIVGLFFLPVICIFIASSTSTLTPNVRIISTSLSFTLPPMLNPIIYVLNTAEIKDTIRKKFKKRIFT